MEFPVSPLGDLDPGAARLLWAFGALLLVLLGSWWGVRWARFRDRRRLTRHRKQGAAGERRALRMLRRAGYEVLQVQVPAEYSLHVDGQLRSFGCRADALVRRGDEVLVAEFKSGPVSARLEHRATRRQILEYAWAFDVDGVVLVNVPGRSIHRIDLPQGGPRRSAARSHRRAG